MPNDVRVAPGRVHDLLTERSDVFFSYGGWTVKYGSIGVRLAKMNVSTMRELVTDSWRHSAPKKLVAAFDAASRA